MLLCRKMKSKTLFYWFGISFFIIAGIYFIWKSTNMTEIVLPKTYEFKFDGRYDSSSKMIFDDFRLAYDFSKEKGIITFILDGYGKQSKIIDINIDIPILRNTSQVYVEALNCEQIRLCTKNSRMNYTSKFINDSTTKKTYVILDGFSRQFDKGERIKFIINFSSSIQPGGTFRFENFQTIRYIEYTLELNFGDDYICSFNCFEIFDGIKSYDIAEKYIFIKFEDSNTHVFKINSINENKLFWKNFWLALGISILATIFMPLLELLPTLIGLNFGKDNNKKTIKKLKKQRNFKKKT